MTTMRAKTVTTLLLAGALAACGGAQDDSGMMDDGSGMMADSAQTDGSMDSEMMEPGMEEDSSTMDDAMGSGSTMMADTLEMARP